VENTKEIHRETYEIGDSILVDTRERVISIPSNMKEEEYDEETKKLVSSGYKVQYNIL
jgi:hypothetical protein